MFTNRKNLIALGAVVIVVLGVGVFIFGNGERVNAWFGSEEADVAAPETTDDLPEGVVIRVNDETVSRQELDEHVEQMVQQQAQMFEMQGEEMPEEQQEQLRERARGQVAQQLVDRLVLLSNAKEQDITIDDGEVEQFLDEQFDSPEERDMALQQMGISMDEAHEEIKDMLVIQRFMEEEIGEIEVDEEEARQFFEQHRGQFEDQDEVQARHILLETDEEADVAAAEAELEDLKDRVEAGEDFGDLAREYSEGPSAPRGGDLGYFGRQDMVEPFAAEAFDMVPGEVRGPIETQFGLHLIKVEDIREGEDISFEDVREEVSQQLREQQQQSRAQEVLQRLRDSAEIETAADIELPPSGPQMAPQPAPEGGQPQP